MWGVIAAINTDLGVSLFLAARAHFEMAGMIAYLLRHCRRFHSGAISADTLREVLQRLFLGRRVGMSFDPPDRGVPLDQQAIQVLNFIDAVNEVFEGEAQAKIAEIRGEFRKGYEWLSEFCHPNLNSRMGGHKWDGPDLIFFRVPTLQEIDIRMTLVHVVGMSHFILSYCFTKCLELLPELPGTEM